MMVASEPRSTQVSGNVERPMPGNNYSGTTLPLGAERSVFMKLIHDVLVDLFPEGGDTK